MGTRLSQPPVFLVLCQVRHSPVLKLESLLPEFQDRMRKKGFPGYRVNKQIGFEFSGDLGKQDDMKVTQREMTTHLLANSDESEIFVAASDSFTFQTTVYGDFERFSELFVMGLSEYRDVVGPTLVTQMGVRFLDLVVPPDGAPVSNYVRCEYLGLYQILEGRWTGNYQFVESSLNRDGQSLKSRVVVRNSTVQLPPDLAGTVRALPPHVAEVNATHAVLDTDASYTPPAGTSMSFELEGITERMTSLKMDASEVFKAIVTAEALKAWE
jgi:uncharacterized protein (TIGR04255 family)